MANYSVENDSIGGGLGGGMNFGGGSCWGLIIFFLFLFSIFSGKRGVFGGDHDDHGYKCGPTNCEVDRDVIDSKYQNLIAGKAEADRVIASETGHYEANQAEKLNDAKMENYFLKGQLADAARNAITDAKIEAIACRMPKMRPEYVVSQLAAVDNCGRGCGNYEYN